MREEQLQKQMILFLGMMQKNNCSLFPKEDEKTFFQIRYKDYHGFPIHKFPFIILMKI